MALLFELQHARVRHDPTYPGQRALCLHAALCKIIKAKHMYTRTAAHSGGPPQECCVKGVRPMTLRKARWATREVSHFPPSYDGAGRAAFCGVVRWRAR